MIWLLTTLALGADLDRYPWSAVVDTSSCEACQAGQGAVRVSIPPLLRSQGEPDDHTDLLLVDAAGEVVPVAWISGRGAPYSESVDVLPTEDPQVVLIEAVDRPMDGLELTLPVNPSAATAQVLVQEEEDGEWLPHGEPALLWNTSDSSHTALRFPPTSGPLRVQLQYHQREPDALPRASLVRLPQPSLEPVSLTVPVQVVALHESGWVSYQAELPHALPAQRLIPEIEQPLFQRQARIPGEDEPLDTAYSYVSEYTIRRTRIGGAQVEDVSLPWPAHHGGRQVVVQVHTQGSPPLDIPSLSLELEGLEAVVLDPPPGPWTLYGGAPQGTSPVHDLRAAAPELWRMAQVVVEADAVVDNPAYQPPELRGGLALPGAELDQRRFAWEREVQAQPGLVAIPLPAEVLAEAASDLSDLRLVDHQGRQIPYLLRQRLGDHTWTELEVAREEDGSTSNIRVTVPQPEVPVAGITLHTEAPLFSRRVSLSRANGAHLETLRAYDWTGQDHPTTLRLELDQVVGETLLVQVDNGDDPPLPLEVVALHWPARELLAWIPEGGASLLYGHPDLSSPWYDLALLREELSRRPAAQATLGPAVSLEPLAPSLLDRIVLGAGLLVLVLGLLVLTLSLLRKVPEEAREGEE